jgi:Rod binding domain-containing protein
MTGLDSSLPPIDQSLLPADVRSGGEKAQQLYGVALGFESLLVDQLTTQLAQTSGLDGSGEGSGDGTDPSPYASLLPGAMAQAVTEGGGLGLARQLYESLSLQQKAVS